MASDKNGKKIEMGDHVKVVPVNETKAVIGVVYELFPDMHSQRGRIDYFSRRFANIGTFICAEAEIVMKADGTLVTNGDSSGSKQIAELSAKLQDAHGRLDQAQKENGKLRAEAQAKADVAKPSVTHPDGALHTSGNASDEKSPVQAASK